MGGAVLTEGREASTMGVVTLLSVHPDAQGRLEVTVGAVVGAAVDDAASVSVTV